MVCADTYGSHTNRKLFSRVLLDRRYTASLKLGKRNVSGYLTWLNSTSNSEKLARTTRLKFQRNRRVETAYHVRHLRKFLPIGTAL